MAKFQYKIKDQNGKSVTGEIDSIDLHSAVTSLRRKGMIIISVSPKTESSLGFLDKILNRVSFNDLVIMTRQLATMVGAGLTLSEAVDILQEQQNSNKLKSVLFDLSNDIKGGLSLFQALSKHRDVFPPLYINLVKSGEASGKLDTVLIRMSDSLEKEREFKARIKGAMIYPAIVVSIMGAVMVIMITFVIPKLTALYKESTMELPLPTKILIGISDFFVSFWWLVILVTIGAVIGFRQWKQTPRGGFIIDQIMLKIPLVNKIVINVTLANFSRTFGLLVAAGIPLLEGISIVENVTDNLVFKIALRSSYKGVEKGLSFSAQLLALPVFPKIVGQMIKVGEETGKVDEIFYKLSDYFESESDHLVKNLTVAIEPIILIILGLGVAFLVISIILPIYKLTTSF